jgi:hypothetical protein
MPFLFHAHPTEMRGETLYPLNQLRTIHPDLYDHDDVEADDAEEHPRSCSNSAFASSTRGREGQVRRPTRRSIRSPGRGPRLSLVPAGGPGQPLI